MSSRSIEGENALYLPQAKIYEKSAALGPCLYVTSSPSKWRNRYQYGDQKRRNFRAYDDSTKVSQIKRSFTELTGYLYRELDFPDGCLFNDRDVSRTIPGFYLGGRRRC